jgi:hypothetical protein
LFEERIDVVPTEETAPVVAEPQRVFDSLDDIGRPSDSVMIRDLTELVQQTQALRVAEKEITTRVVELAAAFFVPTLLRARCSSPR